MANLNDLPLNAETIDDVDPETVPLLGGSANLPPQPGTYTFRLPAAAALFNCFEPEETADQGQRLRALFREDAALWNETLNQSYDSRVSNRVRYINVNDPENPGQKKSIGISDMAQLLRVVNSLPEQKTNTGYGQALIKAANRRFKAEHTLTARCDPARDIYKSGSVIKGKKGCGAKYAVETYTPKQGPPVGTIPKDENNLVSIRFTCGNPKCQAELRCWGQLRSFRKADNPPTE